MKPLVFIASDRRECEPWVAHWQDVKPAGLDALWSRRGTWRGREVVAIMSGVGAGPAQRAAELIAEPAALCSFGTCGALDPSLVTGDVVVAESVTDGTDVWFTSTLKHPEARAGRVICCERIAATEEEKSALHKQGASVVEMEAKGVAKIAQKLAVPFYCVKAVSDVASESFVMDFGRFVRGDGSFDVAGLLLHAMARPAERLPELIKLNGRLKQSTRRLGDFLDGCDF